MRISINVSDILATLVRRKREIKEWEDTMSISKKELVKGVLKELLIIVFRLIKTQHCLHIPVQLL